MNEVKLEGQAVEFNARVSKNGKDWGELVLAVESQSQNGGTEYIPVKCFGKLCEVAKGLVEQNVFVKAHIQIYNWSSPDGNTKSFINIVGEKIVPTDSQNLGFGE